MKVRKIGILMGGFSSERAISLKSGSAVAAALKGLDYDIVILDFQNEFELIEKLHKDKFDCIFNALHGGFGEDGGVQKILDDLNIPYTGSGVRASLLAMDKIASREIFRKNGLPVPEYSVLNRDRRAAADSFLNFPLVVKPRHEGSSIGLSIVEDKKSFSAAAAEALKHDRVIIVEKYISGREITVGILEDHPLPVIEIIPKNKFYDFQAKYTAGMTEYKVLSAASEDVLISAQADALRAHQLLGCRCFSRVDMIVDNDNRPLILEVNTIPGLTTTSLLPKAAAACGIGFGELCQKMILYALKDNLQKMLAQV